MSSLITEALEYFWLRSAEDIMYFMDLIEFVLAWKKRLFGY